MMNGNSGLLQQRAQQIGQSPLVQGIQNAFSTSPIGQQVQQRAGMLRDRMQAMPGYEQLKASPIGAVFSRLMGG